MPTKFDNKLLKGIRDINEKLRSLDVPSHLPTDLKDRVAYESEVIQKALSEFAKVIDLALQVPASKTPQNKRATKKQATANPLISQDSGAIVQGLQELVSAARAGSSTQDLSPKLKSIINGASLPSLKHALRELSKTDAPQKSKATVLKTMDGILSNAYIDGVTFRGER